MRVSNDRDIGMIVILGALADIAEDSARNGDVEAVVNVASRIHERAFSEYAALDGDGEMGEFFLDWTKDYECGGPIYLELLDMASVNSWKQA